MTDSTRTMLAEALRLPPKERAELASQLLASLDGPPDADAEQAWAEEIARRAEEVLAGRAKAEEWHVVRDRAARLFRQ